MTFTLDLRDHQPKFTRPELLQHPQIPGPLAGMNPRTILGKSWWDEVRRTAYHLNNYHCHACGGSPDDDPYGDKLDAHECYVVDWNAAQATYVETVGLCHRCHNFIHSGRLRALVEEGREDEEKLLCILRHGIGILERAGLAPYWRTYVIAQEYLYGLTSHAAVTRARERKMIELADAIRLPDSKWTIVILGTTYRRFNNVIQTVDTV